jgi:hypothetical protein
MGKRSGWLRALLAAGVAAAPSAVWGQDPGTTSERLPEVSFNVPQMIVRAQDSIGTPDPVFPLPLGHDRMETGGFYAAGQFLYWRQTNPIKDQVIATRGFVDFDGSVQAAISVINGTTPTTANFVPGLHFGSGVSALNSEQVSGQNSYKPGYSTTLGWRFSDGSAVEFRWRHLVETKLSAVASIVPPTLSAGATQADTFLFSPVFNFPNDFAGPINKIGVTGPLGAASGSSSASGNASIVPTQLILQTVTAGTNTTSFNGAIISTASASSAGSIIVPQAAFGIWNGASIMSISFVQRYDDFDLVGRYPIFQDDNFRCYGIAGGRHVAMWERFAWRTVDIDTSFPSGQASATVTGGTVTSVSNAAGSTSTPTAGTVTTTAGGGAGLTQAGGFSNPTFAANYSNIVSNQLYGPCIGTGAEYYLGAGFSLSLDLRTALMVDFVKERAKYERADKLISSKFSRTDYTIVPEIDGIATLWWYPIEGVEVSVGYNLMNFFNTVSSPHPVSYDYGTPNPGYDKGVYRMVDGWQAGVALIF